eukprot:1136635-Pelagomonas_calceolata.AAC.5
MKGTPRTLSSRRGRRGNRKHSAPATATPPTSKLRQPSWLPPEQRHVHLVEVKHCGDTRPKDQVWAGSSAPLTL